MVRGLDVSSLPTTRAELEAFQLARLDPLLRTVSAGNPFYRPRLEAAGLASGLASLDEFRRLPFTTKDELLADQERHPPYGSNLTFPLGRYARLHATSGTGGRPLRWLDTPESWRWMLGNWARVFSACDVGPGDRVFFPFSFGPFLGFWTAFEAAWQIGCLALPGGGMSSKARVRVLVENEANVVCATPTYALRLAQTARQEGLDPADSPVAKIVVAGEPGGSVPAVRERLAAAWGGGVRKVQVFDHHGMTEVGPVSYPNPDAAGLLHVIGTSYLAEVVDLDSHVPVAAGERGELILTTLGRDGSPLLRYRTGDLVCVSNRGVVELGTPDLALEGGILARTDDMVVVRGVNLYPSAVDTVVRRFGAVAEYRVDQWHERGMAELRIVLEPAPEVASSAEVRAVVEGVAEALRIQFQLRLSVTAVAPGELPRFELKAKRWQTLAEPPGAPEAPEAPEASTNHTASATAGP